MPEWNVALIYLLLIVNIYFIHQTGLKKTAVASSVHFAERKQFQSEINVGQLVNQNNVRRIISDDQIFSSFRNFRGAPQYFHNTLQDILAKITQFGVYTFFLTSSAD